MKKKLDSYTQTKKVKYDWSDQGNYLMHYIKEVSIKRNFKKMVKFMFTCVYTFPQLKILLVTELGSLIVCS